MSSQSIGRDTRNFWYTRCVSAKIEDSLSTLSLETVTRESGCSREDTVEAVAQLFLSILGSKVFLDLFERRVSSIAINIPGEALLKIPDKLSLNSELALILCNRELDLDTYSFNRKEGAPPLRLRYPVFYHWYLRLEEPRKVFLERQIQNLFFSLPRPQISALSWENTPFIDDLLLQNKLKASRSEILEGTKLLYRILESSGSSDLTVEQQIAILKALFRGYVAGRFTFLIALKDWSLFSLENRKKIDGLYKAISLLDIVWPYELEDENRLRLYKSFDSGLGFQNFVIQISLGLFKKTFLAIWGWIPATDSWLEALQIEEIREDFMIGFIIHPYLLSRGFPLFEPAKNHPLFENHRIFLERIPFIPISPLERKRDVPLSQGYIKACEKLYQMIQDRDILLKYPDIRRTSESKFLESFQIFCEFKNKVMIDKRNDYFVFLKVLLMPLKVNSALKIAKKIEKDLGEEFLSPSFFSLVVIWEYEKINDELVPLLNYTKNNLTVDQVVFLINLYPTFEAGFILAILMLFKEEITKLESSSQNSVMNHFITLVEDQPYELIRIINEKKCNSVFLTDELVKYMNFLQSWDDCWLNKSQMQKGFFRLLEIGFISPGRMIQAVPFIKEIKKQLNIMLSLEDMIFPLASSADFTEWMKAIQMVGKAKMPLLKDRNFSVDPEKYESFESAILPFSHIPETAPEYENGLARFSAKLQDYCKLSVFPSYQHFLDNFYVKMFKRQKAYFSINAKDTTDLQFDHSSIFFEVIPGISIMTAWYPPILGETPCLLVCYIKEGINGVETRFLLNQVNWSIFTDEILMGCLKNKSRDTSSPFIDKEKPPTEFQIAFFYALKILAKHVLLEGNNLSTIDTLTKESFTLPSEDPEDISRPESSSYPDLDELYYPISILENISKNLERIKQKRPHDVRFQENAFTKAFSFFDNLKKEATKSWRSLIHDSLISEKLSKEPSSIQESKEAVSEDKSSISGSTKSLNQETWFDERKNKHSFNRAVLKTASGPKLSTEELCLDILYQAKAFIVECATNAFLGKTKRGQIEKLESRFLNEEGTYKNGYLSISSISCREGYKVTLIVTFSNERTYETRPFIYDNVRLNNPEKFSNLFSVQLLLLKTLFYKIPGQ